MQLTAQQAIKLLANRSNIYADIFVEINGEVVTVSKKLPVTEISEKTIQEFKDDYDSQGVTIKTYAKNGTSWKLQNEYEIVFNSSGSRKTTVNGFDDEDSDFTTEPQFTPPTPTMIPQGANPDLLQYIAHEKAKRADDLEAKNRKLEMDNERWKNKNAKLEQDLAMKDREHELIMQGKDNDSKNSLAGIAERVATPEILAALPGIIQSIKGIGGPATALPAHDLFEGAQQATKDTLTEMITYLKSSPEMTAKMYAITVKAAKNKGLADKILKTIENYN